MRSTFKVLFYVNGSKEKNGIVPIMGRTISENGAVGIPSAEIWMSEMELVELFGVTAPTLRAVIKAIYKNSGFCPTSTQRYNSVTSKSWATFYNLEVIIALAFYLNTREADMIRQRI